jgi:HK97 family phage portal protein
VLDPVRVRPLVASDGSVYYAVNRDPLVGVLEDKIAEWAIPASEIIHDVMVPLYHPLVGISPITACGVAAVQGLRIQEQGAVFFGNGSRPSGVLTAPASISTETATRLKENWDTNFSGSNAGKVAVLGDGLAYQAMSMTATDAQLIEQLKWTAENVCTAFHVPPYMVGVTQMPATGNIEAWNQQYYSQALQNLIESIELLLDEGLELPTNLGIELDLDGLLRMDTATLAEVATKAIQSGNMAPNESRKRFFGLGPVAGGESPYLQQQNFSLAALAKRDALDDPFTRATAKVDASAVGEPDAPTATPAPAPKSQPVTADLDESVLKMLTTGFLREQVTA